MKINEIFRSIQGESTYSGKPCVFIRLSGCNLRCKECDTKYAYEEGEEMNIERILEEIANIMKQGDIIEITGGEPLVQLEEVEKLIPKIRNVIAGAWGYTPTILIETNGSIRLPNWIGCNFIMDWKCPSSGMNAKMEYANLHRLRSRDEIKFVLETDEDYDCMKKLLDHYNLSCKKLIGTTWECSAKKRKELVERMLKDNIRAKFQVQVHKIIWGHEKKGV